MLFLALTTALLSQAEPSLAQGRDVVKAIYAGDATRVWDTASPSLRKQFSTQRKLSAFFDKVRWNFGGEVRLVSEQLTPRPGGSLYSRTAAVAYWARGMTLEIGFDERGGVTSVSALPASKEAPTPYERVTPRTTLRLPFSGAWNVLWGGRSFDDNKHAAVSDQRFALDLLIYQGKNTFTGAGTKNEQYFCWSKPVLAPASGTVVVAIDGFPDNEPNRIRSTESLYGNHVVIDHGNGEFSLLGHLQQGSVRVQPGDAVESGELLAVTGNSGMSTEPHVHYQLMDHADWRRANGLPPVFYELVRNGVATESAELRRADIVQSALFEAQR